MQHYLYKGVEYKSEREVRKTIFEQERKAFGKPKTAAEWSRLGVEIVETEKSEIIAPTLESLKAQKLKALDMEFKRYRESGSTYLISSLGFKANANVTAFDNVSGLVVQLQYKAENGEQNPQVGFMTFDDELVLLNLVQMKTLQAEISKNGSNNYSQKWSIRNAINASQTHKELGAVAIEFYPSDFTKTK